MAGSGLQELCKRNSFRNMEFMRNISWEREEKWSSGGSVSADGG
jgi:hypothetical protein